MELHQLRYLVEVADHGSFTAAAEAMHVSQSGVSAQVAKVERELGARLFERGSRAVRPTAEGRSLLPLARAAVRAVDDLRTAADELAGVARGHVRVGTVIGCAIPGFLAGFAEFRSHYSGVTVEVTEGNSDDLVADLMSGSLDVALVAHAEALPVGIASRILVREGLAAAVALGHPWAGRDRVTPADLATQTVLCLPRGTGVRAALDATGARAGVEVAVAVQAHSPDALLALAAQGAGVTVLSNSMIRRDDVVAVPLSRSVQNHLTLATRANPSAAARAMESALLRHLDPAA